MTTAAVENWHAANQRYLLAALEQVRKSLERHLSDDGKRPETVSEFAADFQDPTAAIDPAPALTALCETFHLSMFERAILVMCAGVELDESFARLCASIQGEPRRNCATFGLALAALHDAHWSALSPAGPLRYWRLIEPVVDGRLTASPLRIDERILHFLAGVDFLDDRLAVLVEPLPEPVDLPVSHEPLARQLCSAWTSDAAGNPLPVIHLTGDDAATQQDIANSACGLMGIRLHRMSAGVLPTDQRELDSLVRLWQREVLLSGTAILLDCHDLESADTARSRAGVQFIDRLGGALIVISRGRSLTWRRRTVMFEVLPATTQEQQKLWRQTLSTTKISMNGHIDQLVSQFNLSPAAIRAAGVEAMQRLQRGDDRTVADAEAAADSESRHSANRRATDASDRSDDLRRVLWDVCRIRSRPQLDTLAQRIQAVSAWDDLVLPEAQLRRAKEIAVHVRQRLRVYETWGFAERSSRGLGITALFSGPSGTGKTMASEVLATHLQLDLYRIDLSQVISKYIGETEKNLRRVFDAAEGSGAILLFDEADALFGKRSEVKDSHDRHANIEVSYLLQRMEAYRGLAILTTNMQESLDTAFLRRIRFVIRFPFPEVEQRAEIWRRIFPARTPTENLDIAKLSRLNVSGGNIRNIAMHGAFLAADHDQPVRMSHLLCAARTEYSKLEKTLTESETEGWT